MVKNCSNHTHIQFRWSNPQMFLEIIKILYSVGDKSYATEITLKFNLGWFKF